MKNSGVEWIGEIPEDWEVTPLKKLFSFGKGLPITKENLVKKGLPVISYGQIHSKSNTGTKLQSELLRYVSNSYLDSNPNSLVHSGDFIFADTSEDLEGCGNCCYIDKEIKLFAGYHTVILQSKISKDNKYLAYLFKTDEWRKQLREKLVEVKLYSITQKALKSTSVILPPKETQQRIALYLDKKCSKIEETIQNQQQVIEKLKAYKQSLITEAVTGKVKIVNGKACGEYESYKDSGVEWIGKIPLDWNIKRLKNLFDFGKGLPITKENLKETGVSVISYGQIHSKQNSGTRIDDSLKRFVDESYLISNSNSLVHKSDFIFADTSEDLEGCGNCVYVDEEQTLFAGYHTIIFSSKIKQSNKYLAYLFKTDAWRNQIRSRCNGVKLFSITKRILSNVNVILPPLAEQEAIAKMLDSKCAQIDSLIAEKESLIADLTEYKKSLIFEVVTGKRRI